MGRRPNKLDRAYFEKKKNPNYDDLDAVTKCCGEPKTKTGLMKGNKQDWKLIENHIEEHLRKYSSTLSVEPIFCKECGRFQEYLCEQDVDQTLGYRKKNDRN
mgnify:FL=1|tara:strand:- start:10 stop:315 length:306 start_codon:yes stop_codon:yes gene_type:complete